MKVVILTHLLSGKLLCHRKSVDLQEQLVYPIATVARACVRCVLPNAVPKVCNLVTMTATADVSCVLTVLPS